MENLSAEPSEAAIQKKIGLDKLEFYKIEIVILYYHLTHVEILDLCADLNSSTKRFRRLFEIQTREIEMIRRLIEEKEEAVTDKRKLLAYFSAVQHLIDDFEKSYYKTRLEFFHFLSQVNR